MIIPVRPSLVSTLLPAALPPLVLGALVAALWGHAGGAELGRLVGAAGLFSVVLVGVGVSVVLASSVLLALASLGRVLPVLALAGPALLPWLLGMAGAKGAMEQVLSALPPAVDAGVLPVLAQGLGAGMAGRLVGAGMSAALLVSVGVGLLLVQHAPGASKRGLRGEQQLGAAVCLALGGVGLLVALESYRLFELLSALPQTEAAQQAALVAAHSDKLSVLHGLHLALLGTLVVLALAEVALPLFQSPRDMARWATHLVLAALVAMMMVLDARPLGPSQQGQQVSRLLRSLLPAAEASPSSPQGSEGSPAEPESAPRRPSPHMTL